MSLSGQVPSIVIDASIKEKVYALIEEQRRSHQESVTQLAAALEESYREARFLRQQLGNSNEMLQDAQAQLRRTADDKAAMLTRLQERDAEVHALTEANEKLRARVEGDLEELEQVRSLVKAAMEETYKSRAYMAHGVDADAGSALRGGRGAVLLPQVDSSRLHPAASSHQQQSGQQQPGQQHADPVSALQATERLLAQAPSRATNGGVVGLGATAGGSSRLYTNAPTPHPPNVGATAAAVAFGSASPPQSGLRPPGPFVDEVHGQPQSPLRFAMHRGPTGDVAVRAVDFGAAPAAAASSSSGIVATPAQRTLASSLRTVMEPQRPSVQPAATTLGDSTSSAALAASIGGVGLRALQIDTGLSRGISVSPHGHVAVATDDTAPALCVYRDIRGAAPSGATAAATFTFEAAFRCADAALVVVGIALLSPQAGTSAGAPPLAARCGIRGDGVLVLVTEDGAAFEARSGLPALSTTGAKAAISVRYDEATGRAFFSHGADGMGVAVPVQVPRVFLGAPQGRLVPFVCLPRAGDEVVVRHASR